MEIKLSPQHVKMAAAIAVLVFGLLAAPQVTNGLLLAAILAVLVRRNGL